MSVRLSILMPVYNAAATLGAALDSVLAQTWSDLELVAVDDGSTDASLSILRRRARGDPRLKVVAAPHAGLVAALQRAAASARGDLLGRMDADDLSAPDRFEKQIARLQSTGADVCSCRVGLPPGAHAVTGMPHYLEWMNGLDTHEAMARERFVESPLAHPSVVMRREAFERVGGYEDRGWAEDYDLWLRLFEAGARFVKCPETLFFWSDLPTRATRADSRYSLDNFLRAKAHYLLRALLPEGRPFLLWGGRYAKRLGRRLHELDRVPEAYVDIDPKRIGGHVAYAARPGPGDPRVPVIGPDALPPPGEALVFVAVGSRGASDAREEVCARLSGQGHRETVDFWRVA